MTTLVTGGSGLVGSAIEADMKPSSEEFNLMMHPTTLANYLRESGVTKIIHCAAKVGGIKANSEQLGDFYYENIIMNSHLLEASLDFHKGMNLRIPNVLNVLYNISRRVLYLKG